MPIWSPGLQGPQGPAGVDGLQGQQGSTGPAGPGIATGGTTGQILAKASNADYATSWINAAPPVAPGGLSGQVQYASAGTFAGTPALVIAASGALVTAQAQASADRPLVIKGASSQTANLQEWRDSTGTLLLAVDASGYLTNPSNQVRLKHTSQSTYALLDSAGPGSYGALNLTGTNVVYAESNRLSFGDVTNAKGFIFRGATAAFYPLNNAVDWGSQWTQTSNGYGVAFSKALWIGNTAAPANANVALNISVAGAVGGAAAKGIVVQAAASQSANLQEWQNSTGSPLVFITAAGALNFQPGNRSYTINTPDSSGYFTFSRSDVAAALYLWPTSATLVTFGNTLAVGDMALQLNNGKIILTPSNGGGAGLIQLGRRSSDSNAACGASVEFWTVTNQSTPALAVKAPGGASNLCQINANGLILPVQAPTASAPAYVKGGVYFDTTLNKLMVGGATAWETVTSA